MRLPALLLTAAAALATATCVDHEQVAGLRDAASIGPTQEPTASNPITQPAGAIGGAGGLSASVTAGPDPAYVSLPPGMVPDGGLATIDNTRLQVEVVAPLQDGGFDPVSIAAAPGDVVEIAVQRSGGAVVSYTLTVPRAARPKVVRADPPPRKRDVPLNTQIVVVFSEPIQAGTEAGVTLMLAGAPVSGRAVLSDDHLHVAFQPSGLLAPNTTYEISVSTAVTDLTGDALAQPVAADFTTGTSQIGANVATDPAALITSPSNGELRTQTMSAVRLDDGRVSGTFSFFYPATGERVFGRVTCFTILGGTAAWVAGVIEGANDTSTIRREVGWRVADNGPPGSAVPDQLSLSYDLADYNLGTAENFCATTPVTAPRIGLIGLYDLVSGNIVVNESGPPPPPPTGGVSQIAYAVWPNGGIQVIDADGTNGRVLTSALGDFSPAWSPDGTKLAFDRYQGDPLLGDIYVINVDGSGIRRLTADQSDDSDPAWSPDGSKIAFGRDGAIYVMNASDGSGLQQVTLGGYDFHPTWSPDGTQIAFASSRTGTNAIYVMASDGTGIRQITSDSAGDYNPWWSPDGSRIAFQRGEYGPGAINLAANLGIIYLINPDGTGLTKLTLVGRTPSWSHDSRVIAFEKYGLTLVNRDGSGMLRLGIGFDPAWSPGGSMPPRPQPYVSLTLAGGDGQAGPVGTRLREPLIVRATRGDGSPVSGAHVSWYVPNGDLTSGAYLSTALSITDALGFAQAWLTLGGSAPLQFKIQAIVTDGTGLTPGVEFTATTGSLSNAPPAVRPTHQPSDARTIPGGPP